MVFESLHGHKTAKEFRTAYFKFFYAIFFEQTGNIFYSGLDCLLGLTDDGRVIFNFGKSLGKLVITSLCVP